MYDMRITPMITHGSIGENEEELFPRREARVHTRPTVQRGRRTAAGMMRGGWVGQKKLQIVRPSTHTHTQGQTEARLLECAIVERRATCSTGVGGWIREPTLHAAHDELRTPGGPGACASYLLHRLDRAPVETPTRTKGTTRSHSRANRIPLRPVECNRRANSVTPEACKLGCGIWRKEFVKRRPHTHRHTLTGAG